MKRVGNLFGEVSSYENLREAFRLAMRGAGNSRAACRFFFHLEPELLELQRELRSGTYTPGRYRYMHICDPKERRIAVAPFRDRVVHHAVVRVLTPVYEPVFIFDSYASRKGKGHPRGRPSSTAVPVPLAVVPEGRRGQVFRQR